MSTGLFLLLRGIEYINTPADFAVFSGFLVCDIVAIFITALLNH